MQHPSLQNAKAMIPSVLIKSRQPSTPSSTDPGFHYGISLLSTESSLAADILQVVPDEPGSGVQDRSTCSHCCIFLVDTTSQEPLHLPSDAGGHAVSLPPLWETRLSSVGTRSRGPRLPLITAKVVCLASAIRTFSQWNTEDCRSLDGATG